MKSFLRIYKVVLFVFAMFIMVLVSFCLGYGVPELISLPEQLDARNALDQISCEMTIREVRQIVSDSGFCQTISKTVDSLDTPWKYGDKLVWARKEKNINCWQSCLFVSFIGTMWTHEYGFWFDEAGRMQGIFVSESSRYVDGQPLAWEWNPKFSEKPKSDR
jgi:hypothetical protein